MHVQCFACEVLIAADDLDGVINAFVAHGQQVHNWSYPEEAVRNYAEATERLTGRTCSPPGVGNQESLWGHASRTNRITGHRWGPRPEPERVLAERLHALIKANAPALSPKTWYGMPAYANEDGKVVCFFQNAVRNVRLPARCAPRRGCHVAGTFLL